MECTPVVRHDNEGQVVKQTRVRVECLELDTLAAKY
jgi:hypothetical protein